MAGTAGADVIINEVMASNGTYENGEAYDWVELYNDGDKAADISGWYLSDSKKNPLKWAFPQGTKIKAGGYVTVFCTGEEVKNAGKGSVFYTDWAISSSGETLILSDAEGAELSRVKMPEQYGNVSWGRPAGGGEYEVHQVIKKQRQAFPEKGMPAFCLPFILFIFFFASTWGINVRSIVVQTPWSGVCTRFALTNSSRLPS